MMMDLSFYKGKKVLVTGHTGFKGAWMCEVLLLAGAEVTGYALEPPTDPALFNMLSLADRMDSVMGDVRDREHLKRVFEETRPEIVIHMAAQPLVRESYQQPAYTYEVNVMGTVNVLECIRLTDSVRSFVNVTTDKVYRNREWEWGYRENEELNGYDPYSNSKSCSELVTDSYKNSFFQEREVAISTMRAGNVIGGGDFACDRIIPDCVRAAQKGEDILIRNPYAIRPFQHVLEPVMAYLLVAKEQYKHREFQGAYNVGPDENDCIRAGELATVFCDDWNLLCGGNISWIAGKVEGPHEAFLLKLDCSRMKHVFQWRPRWNIETAVRRTVEFYAGMNGQASVCQLVQTQIRDYLEAATH